MFFKTYATSFSQIEGMREGAIYADVCGCTEALVRDVVFDRLASLILRNKPAALHARRKPFIVIKFITGSEKQRAKSAAILVDVNTRWE